MKSPRTITRMQLVDAGRTSCAVIATFGIVTLIAHVGGQSDSLIVFGVVLCLTSARAAARRGPHSTTNLVRRAVEFPIVAVAVAGLAIVFEHELVLGDALFVAAAFAALWTRRFSPQVSDVARMAQLALLALFIAPVPPADRGFHGLPWLMVAAVVADSCSILVQLPGRVRSTGKASEAGQAEAGQAEAAPSHAGPPPPLPRTQPGPAGRTLPGPGARTLPRPLGTTKLALQTAAGLTMAFVVAQHCFSPRWTWTVVSAFTVGAGARSRGDVLVRGGERLIGALAGTALATLVATSVGGHRDVAVALIFVLLIIGIVLRELTYAAWAFCVTGALALLYGLSGESAVHLLGDRLAQVGVGAACAIGAAFIVYPIRTEAITRKAMAEMLAGVDELLVGASGPSNEPAMIRPSGTSPTATPSARSGPGACSSLSLMPAPAVVSPPGWAEP